MTCGRKPNLWPPRVWLTQADRTWALRAVEREPRCLGAVLVREAGLRTCSSLCSAWGPQLRPGRKAEELDPSVPGEAAGRGIGSLSSYCVLGCPCFQAATRGGRWYHPVYRTKAMRGQETGLSQQPTNKGRGGTPRPMSFSCGRPGHEEAGAGLRWQDQFPLCPGMKRSRPGPVLWTEQGAWLEAAALTS